MSRQQLIIEYLSVDDRNELDDGIEADVHDTVRFDLLGRDESMNNHPRSADCKTDFYPRYSVSKEIQESLTVV